MNLIQIFQLYAWSFLVLLVLNIALCYFLSSSSKEFFRNILTGLIFILLALLGCWLIISGVPFIV